MKHPKTLAACLLLPAWLALAGAASAQAAMPTHYNMPNGYGMASGGSFNYWDGSYSGSGDRSTDYAPLSGGLGDLTDGVIATQSWIEVENVEAPAPTWAGTSAIPGSSTSTSPRRWTSPR